MKSRRARVGLSIFLVSNSNQTLSFDTFHKDLCHRDCCSGSYGIWDNCSECFCHATEDSDN